MVHMFEDGRMSTSDAEHTATQVYLAQRYAGVLGGITLERAARSAASVAQCGRWELVAADSSGERILGVASLVGGAIADTSRRLDGKKLLVVAGRIAGPYGIAQAAWIARGAGALEVHAAHLGGWEGPIDGCDSVQNLECLVDKVAASGSPTMR